MIPLHHCLAGGAVHKDGDGIETVQRYDPRTDSWMEMASMLIARSGSAACVLNDHIFVIGKIVKNKAVLPFLLHFLPIIYQFDGLQEDGTLLQRTPIRWSLMILRKTNGGLGLQ